MVFERTRSTSSFSVRSDDGGGGCALFYLIVKDVLTTSRQSRPIMDIFADM
jgi:hypothetical protein